MDTPIDQQVGIKIKTIDNQTFEFTINLKMIVMDLKKLIEKTLNIPINRQRLIFKGKMLNNIDSLSQHKIEDGNVLHLVGNAMTPNSVHNIDDYVAQNNSPTIMRGQSTSSLDEPEAFGGLVRTLNDTQENRRQSRRKVLQQRLQGFPHLPARPCPALYQNLLTMTQLLKSLSSVAEFQEIGQVFNQNRDFDIGMWIDVKDPNNDWQEAQIIQKHANHVFIHYNSLGSRLQEEWFHMSSPRLAAFRSHTVQITGNSFMSPTPSTQPILQGVGCQSLGELLGTTAVLMIRVGNMMKRIADERNNRESSNQSQKSQSEMQSLINGMIEEQRRNQEKDDKMDSKSFQQENDATSLKSLKSIKSEKISVDYETSSIKSMKSDISKLTNVYNSNVAHTLQENITEEEEDSQEEVTSDNEQINLANNLSKDSKETTTTTGREWDATLLAAQLAPITDRLGRLLIDLSPYLAITGSQIQNIIPNTHIHNISNLSIITNEDSQYSGGLLNQNYYFQVPVMLTPQEFQSLPQMNVQRAVGDNVDIHIHTYIPQNNYQQTMNTPQSQSQGVNQSNLIRQQDQVIQTNKPKSRISTVDQITKVEKTKDKPRSSLLSNQEQFKQPTNVKQHTNVDQQEKKERKKKLKEVSFSEQIFQLKKQINKEEQQ